MTNKVPHAPAKPSEPRVYHGITLSDDYHWLRAENWQDVMRDPSLLDAEIREYLEAENAYTESEMAGTEALQETLFAEMRGRIKEDDSSVPSPHGEWAYYSSYTEGAEYPLLCRIPRADLDNLKYNPETEEPIDPGGSVLLDCNTLADGHDYFSLGGAAHTNDHALMVYGIDVNGSERYTLRVRDLTSGKELADEVPETSGGATWHPDRSAFYYTELDENLRPLKIMRHKLGAPVAADELIFQEQPGFYASTGATQSEGFIEISTGDHEKTEIHLIDTTVPDAKPVIVAERSSEHEYSVEHVGDRLIILTNSGGAEDFRIVEMPISALSDPDRSLEKVMQTWTEIEPHRPGRLILGIDVLANHLIRLERENGLPRIVIRRLSDGEEHEIAFDEEAYSLGISTGYEFDTTAIRFTYSSMTTPTRVYDYDVETRERVLRKRQIVPSGHNPADYVTSRIMAPAHDGEQVPISLLYHKDTLLNGTAPCLLYGYGAYGIAMPASFSTGRLSLVDRGFVYAIAHIRGGKDKGYGWYKSGKLEKKTNTFHDFISAGEHLARENITSRGAIIGHGGSAGGLLMGAVANMAPDLFGGIIAEVPFVDVLNTILDDTLPLTPPEWLEWGNPIIDADAFNRMQAYSPYDQVKAQNYPNMLVLAGLTDPRVTYWEPAKWVAKLRALKTDANLLLLKTNMGAGHGGASGRFNRLREVALSYAFALTVAQKVTGKRLLAAAD